MNKLRPPGTNQKWQQARERRIRALRRAWIKRLRRRR